jgi:4-amino-4-deoxy-L-arabinose transferase-like glycosyltransferase
MLHKPLLILIIILGFFVRIWNLSSNPYGFFSDEAASGYNAYSLLTTGKDEYGTPWPFYFRSFGDYRNPVAIYSMIPFIGLFGLNEFSVRIPMAIYGTATILLVYLLTKELFEVATALVASLFLAISPWHIHFSRTGFEFTPLNFYLILGLWLFFKFRNNHQKIWLILSMLAFIITFYTYYPIQLVLPILLTGLFLIFPLRKKHLFLSVFLLFLGLTPFFIGIIKGEAQSRFNSISSFPKDKTSRQIIWQIANSYLGHFSQSFLFTKGDIDYSGHNLSRHSVKGVGQLYLFQAPLLIIGLIILFKKHFQLGLFMGLWLLLYPLGSLAVIYDGPFANRSIFGVVPFQVISALGLAYLFMLKKTKIVNIMLLAIFFLVIGLSFGKYFYLLIAQYPKYSSDYWGWQSGPHEIMAYFLAHKNEYSDLYLSGEFNGPDIFIKFYDPKNLCQSKCKIGDLNSFRPGTRQLFAMSPDALSKSAYTNRFIVKKTLLYPSGKPAFIIGKVN